MLGRAAFISRIKSPEMADSNAPVWLITGCSTGFGRELSRALLARGHRVAATARNPESIDDLVAGHEGRAIALRLDVTNPAEVDAAVRHAEKTFGRIDVHASGSAVVRLAGRTEITAAGAGVVEEVSVEVGQRVEGGLVVRPGLKSGSRVVVAGAAGLYSREFHKPPGSGPSVIDDDD